MNKILIKSSPDINLHDFNFQPKDTLLYAEEISLLFNLRSLISKRYELKKIVISRAKLYLLIDKLGNNNYRVVTSSETGVKSDSIIVQLTSIDLNDTEVHYFDAGQLLHLTAFTTNSQISGEFSENNFDIQLKTSLQNSKLVFKGKEYFDETFAKMSLQIKKSWNSYYFNKGNANILGINIAIQGKYDKSKEFYQFTTESKEVSITRISLPAWIKFLRKNNIQIERGNLDMRTSISGYTGQERPLILSDFIAQKVGLKNLQKKITIRNIFLQGQYMLDINGIATIKLDTLSMQSDKSQIYGSCSLRNLNKPLIEGNIRGILELKKIMLFETVARRIELDGIIKGELVMNGTLSTKQDSWKNNIMNVFKSGQIQIEDGFIRPLMNPFPAASVNGTIRLKGIRNVWFDHVSLKTGKSDLMISGSVTDLPLFSGDRSIFPVYRCTVSSDEFHVEDFLVGERQDDKENDLTVQLPDSMIVIAQVKVKKFYFGKFSASNGEGSVHYQPKILSLKDFSMESQQGKIFSEIIVYQRNNRLTTKSKANFQKVDLGDMFYAFNNFGQKVISAENLDGALTGNATLFIDWDFHLKPFLENLELRSSISIEDGELINYQPLLGLSKFIEVEELKHIKFDKLETDITIKKEIVTISETNINSSAVSLIGSGKHDFENRYKYYMQVQLSDILWNKAKKKKPENTEFGYVIDDGLGKTSIPLVIEGKDKEFEVYYDKQKGRSTFREKVQEEKEEFRRLLKSKNKEEIEGDNQELKLEWENDTVNSNQNETQINTQSQMENDDKEFIIEWEDE